MSYGFDMQFLQAESMETALLLAHKYVAFQSTDEKMREMIEENKYFIPSIRWNCKITEKRLGRIADEKWLYSLFNFNFVYWPKYHLLGLVGTAGQNDESKWESVYFQNSCDQDYEFEDWPENIDFFRTIVKEYKQMLELDDTSCIKRLEERGYLSDYFDDEDLDESPVEYSVKTSLYKEVFRRLDLDAWLYGRSSDLFERFSMNALTTSEKALDMSICVRKIVKREMGDIQQKKITLIPLYYKSGKAPCILILEYESEYSEEISEDIVLERVRKAADGYLNSEDGLRFQKEHKSSQLKDLISVIPTGFFIKAGLRPLKVLQSCNLINLTGMSV